MHVICKRKCKWAGASAQHASREVEEHGQIAIRAPGTWSQGLGERPGWEHLSEDPRSRALCTPP